MKLDEIINASMQAVQPVQEQPTQGTSNDEVEKLAEYLEAFAEEDTLLDDLARAAVLVDMLERRRGH